MGTEAFLQRPLLGLLSNLPVVLGAAAMLLVLVPSFRSLLERRPTLLLASAFIATRVVFAILVVGMLGHVSSDLTDFFLSHAESVRAGGLPYRDFTCSYSPVFPYLLALATLIPPGGAVAVLALFVLADGLALLLLRAAGGGPRAGWLYAVAPVTWFFLVRYSQDEALVALALVAVLALLLRGSILMAGVVFAIGLLSTKFIFGLFLPPLLIASPRPVRLGMGVAVPLVVVAVGLAAVGAHLWSPLFEEATKLGSGPGIWRLPVLFTALRPGAGVSAIAVTVMVAAWVTMYARRATLSALGMLLATGLLFLVVSPKAYPMYAAMFWPVAAVWWEREGKRGDLFLLTAANLLLGCWWYLDAGGVQGFFGPVVQGIAIFWTAAIPVVLAWQAARVMRSATGSAPAALPSFSPDQAGH